MNYDLNVKLINKEESVLFLYVDNMSVSSQGPVLKKISPASCEHLCSSLMTSIQ